MQLLLSQTGATRIRIVGQLGAWLRWMVTRHVDNLVAVESFVAVVPVGREEDKCGGPSGTDLQPR